MRFIPLYSGSSGNCSLIEADGVRLLIDAGMAGKAIVCALTSAGIDPATVNGILITHEHSDHIHGAGVLCRRYDVPIYANSGTWGAMEPLIGAIAPRNVRVFETGRDFYIRSLNVLPFATPHDAAEPVGYCFANGRMKLSLMTDIGHIDERLLCAVENSDLLMIESNHDVDMLMAGSYPYPLKRRILGERGHLSNESCGTALARLYARGVRNAILGHLSRENNFESLAMESVRAVLRNEDIQDEAMRLTVAHRDRPTGIFAIGEA